MSRQPRIEDRIMTFVMAEDALIGHYLIMDAATGKMRVTRPGDTHYDAVAMNNYKAGEVVVVKIPASGYVMHRRDVERPEDV